MPKQELAISPTTQRTRIIATAAHPPAVIAAMTAFVPAIAAFAAETVALAVRWTVCTAALAAALTVCTAFGVFFCGTFGHLRRFGTDRWRLYDDAAGPLYGASTCPHCFFGLGRMGSLHCFLRLVFPQYVPAFLHLRPCLVRISPCIRKATAAPLPELKVQLGDCALRRALQLLSAVLLRRSLRRSSAALGSILCADSGRLQALSGNRRTVNGLNGSLDGLSCFQVCHCAPLPNRFSGNVEIFPVLLLRLQVP